MMFVQRQICCHMNCWEGKFFYYSHWKSDFKRRDYHSVAGWVSIGHLDDWVGFFFFSILLTPSTSSVAWAMPGCCGAEPFFFFHALRLESYNPPAVGDIVSSLLALPACRGATCHGFLQHTCHLIYFVLFPDGQFPSLPLFFVFFGVHSVLRPLFSSCRISLYGQLSSTPCGNPDHTRMFCWVLSY